MKSVKPAAILALAAMALVAAAAVNPDDIMLKKPAAQPKPAPAVIDLWLDEIGSAKAEQTAPRPAVAEKPKPAAPSPAIADLLADELKAAPKETPAPAPKPAAAKPAAAPATKPAPAPAAEDARAKAEIEALRKKLAAAQKQSAAAEERAKQAALENAKREKADAAADAQSRAEIEKLRKELEAAKAAEAAALAKAKRAAELGKKAAAAAKAETAAAKEAQSKAEAAMVKAVQKAKSEKEERERIAAGLDAAEARAAADRKAAQRAVAEKEAAERKVQRLMNPEPDEKRPAKRMAAPAGAGKDVLADSAKGPAAADKKPKAKPTGRDAVITADRTDYDRKEGVILFDRNVYVDDEQYQMHADRLFVFLDGTNELKRLVAIGRVSITNEEKVAACSRAVYLKSAGKITMYGNDSAKAMLDDGAKKGGTVRGDKITFWLNSEQVEIEGPVVSMPGGGMKGASPKELFNGMK